MSLEEIVSPDSSHIPGKTHLDSPEEGLMELCRIYNTEDNLSSFYLTRISLWAAYFGDAEFAMDALEKSAEISSGLVHFWFPVFHKVRQLPRFKEFLREIGLVDYWKEYGWPDTNICRPIGDDDFVCE